MLYAGSINAQYERLWKVEQENNMTLERPQVVVRADAIGGIVMAYTYDDAGDTNVVVKGLTPQGATRWTTVINESQESVVDVIIDLKFNNYILGHYNQHGFIAKVDSTGNQIWFTELKQSSSSKEVITAFALRNDTIVIVGSSTLSSQERGVVISVSALSGNVLNSSYYNGGEAAVRYLDVAFDENGKSFACGYIEDGGNYNAILHAYNKNLTGYWTTTLQSNAGEDIAYGVCTDLAGNVFSTGCYTQSSNTKIFTCKYSTAGTKKWVNTYDTEGEDRGLYIDFKSDTIAVSGITKQEDSYKDVITLSILTGGSTNWYQVFSGNEGLDDVPTDVRIHEGSVIVPVTGHVVSDNTSALVLLYRSANGNAQHSDRPPAIEGVHTMSANVDVDPMGNVLMAYDAENANNKYNVAVAKLNRFGVNQKAIQQTLKMLAVGCIPLRTNTSVKEIIYNRIGMVVDSFAQTSVRMLIAACARDSIFIEQEMDAAIAAGFNWADSVTWTQIGIQRLYYKLSKMNPMLYVDNYYAFADITFINATPPIAYTYLELDYPFNVVTTTNGTLTKTNALSFPSWNLIAVPAPWQMHKMGLRYCIYEINSYGCEMCNSPVAAPYSYAVGGNTQDHEIGIAHGLTGSSLWTNLTGFNSVNGVCGNITAIEWTGLVDPSFPISNYGTGFQALYAVGGLDYWRRFMDSTLGAFTMNLARLPSNQGPIVNRHFMENGWSATLCQNFSRFNDFAEQTKHLALGQGGVYKLVTPEYSYPLYFAFPYTSTLWYSDGPDMNFAVLMSHFDELAPACSNGEYEVDDQILLGPSPMISQGAVAHGYTASEAQSYLINTNFNTIYNYWSDNVVTVGLSPAYNTLCDSNHVVVFNADTVTSNNCVPSTYGNLGPLLQQLNCDSSMDYLQIGADFSSNQTVNAGDQVLVHVQAEFANGETLNDCQVVTIQTGFTAIKRVQVEVRGKLMPIQNNATYVVSLYKLL